MEIVKMVVLTLLLYMAIPVLIRIIIKKPLSNKISNLISFLNSLGVWAGFLLLYINLNIKGEIPNVAPAVLYYFINRGMLSHGNGEIVKTKKLKSFRLTK